jgi:hypothetical protein
MLASIAASAAALLTRPPLQAAPAEADAIHEQAVRLAAIRKANAEAGRKRAIAQKRAIDTKLWSKQIKQAERAENAAAIEAEQRHMQELERTKAKMERKAQREAKRALSVTKPVHTKTKINSHTRVPITQPVTNINAPMPRTATTPLVIHAPTRNYVVGSNPAGFKPRKSPLHSSRLSRWLQTDRHAAALALQRAWRRHAAKQVRLLLMFERAAERKTNEAQQFTSKTQPRAKCRYNPCQTHWCHFAHEPGQQQLAPCAAKQTDGKATIECGICFASGAPIAVLVQCGHTLCYSCSGKVTQCPFCATRVTTHFAAGARLPLTVANLSGHWRATRSQVMLLIDLFRWFAATLRRAVVCFRVRCVSFVKSVVRGTFSLQKT